VEFIVDVSVAFPDINKLQACRAQATTAHLLADSLPNCNKNIVASTGW